MLTLRVGCKGDAPTIAQALAKVPSSQPLTLVLAEGVYCEKIFCERPLLRLVGAGEDKTRILWRDGAFDRHADGRKNGTFRSYTAFFDGDLLMVENLTIENGAGDGRLRGQAIAAAVYTRCAWFKQVQLLGHQDTLFIGPLPEKERLPDGFLGPRRNAPRVPTRQLYESCRISGDVDFIFGGGDALFLQCRLHKVGDRPGYLAAPSTAPNGAGFIFDRCAITSDTPRQLCLARPWRPGARAVFLECTTGDAVAPQRFDAWHCAPGSFEFLTYPVPQNDDGISRALLPEEAQRWHNVVQQLTDAVKTQFSEIL